MSELHDEQALSELRNIATTLGVDLTAHGMREFVTIYLAHDIGELRARVADLEDKIEEFETKARIEREIEDDIVTAIGETDVSRRPDQSGEVES